MSGTSVTHEEVNIGIIKPLVSNMAKRVMKSLFNKSLLEWIKLEFSLNWFFAELHQQTLHFLNLLYTAVLK